MIKDFAHKGLEKFYQTGNSAGINSDFVKRLTKLLRHLNRARTEKDMDLPGYNLHSLKGNLGGYWSVKVNKNWRLVFRFEAENAYNVDLVDYH